MKTVLIVDSMKERDISFDFGLDTRLALRVTVHTAKAARVAINTVQFDMAFLGEVPDVEDAPGFLKELEQVIPKVFRTVGKTPEFMASAHVDVLHPISDDAE